MACAHQQPSRRDAGVSMLGLVFAGCTRPSAEPQLVTVFEWTDNQWQQDQRPLTVRSGAEWREQLGEMGYFVMRQKGTEKPFLNRFHAEAELFVGGDGLYRCRGCKLPLFWARDQFVSSSGWPSFYQPANAANVLLRYDGDRTEVICRGCNGHLGHVFYDGLPEPKAGRRRFCMNSAALRLDAKLPLKSRTKPTDSKSSPEEQF